MLKSFLKAAAVRVNPLATVPIRKTQIEYCLSFRAAKPQIFQLAHASGPSAEAMNEPLELVEWLRLQNLEAATLAQSPLRLRGSWPRNLGNICFLSGSYRHLDSHEHFRL